jgi:MPBQ/MSBQ methyltransferase
MFCTHVLGLRSLHWGLWEEADAMTLGGLRTAQARYTQNLLASVPAGVRTILDVGCGMGDNAAALADRGYEVTAIAPIANYVDHLATLRTRGVTFTQEKIETFESARPFDLVLMSESCGYFTAEVAFEKSRRLLRPGGHLLVCNMFRLEPVPLKVAAHVLPDFMCQASRSGFRVVLDEDITRATLPSLRLAMALWATHGAPAVGLGALYLRSASWRTRLALRIAQWFFSDEVARLAQSLDTYAEQLNPELVARHACYKLLLFRREEAPPAHASRSTD